MVADRKGPTVDLAGRHRSCWWRVGPKGGTGTSFSRSSTREVVDALLGIRSELRRVRLQSFRALPCSVAGLTVSRYGQPDWRRNLPQGGVA
jgi:hypothetical protein